MKMKTRMPKQIRRLLEKSWAKCAKYKRPGGIAQRRKDAEVRISASLRLERSGREPWPLFPAHAGWGGSEEIRGRIGGTLWLRSPHASVQRGVERTEGEEAGATERGEPALAAGTQQERVKQGGRREADAKTLP